MSEANGQFASPADEIDSLRRHVAELQDTLKETEASLVEFEESSKDVEREMDKEIRDAERRERELRTQVERSNAQIDEWKGKYQAAITEHNKYHAEMEREMMTVREQQKRYKDTMRDMEVSNDELENAERMIASSLADMEGRYNKALERTVLLEEELVAKSRLEDDNQRLRDELQELTEELLIAREQAAAAKRAPAAGMPSYAGEDLSLADLVVKPAPSSRASSRATTTGTMSPAPVKSSLSNITNRSTTQRGAHARRGSRDVRANELMEPPGADDSPSLRASRMRRDVGIITPGPRPSFTSSTATATGRAPARRTSVAPSTTGKSLNMMHLLQSRMRALETRINSARNLASIAPVVDLDRSAIPRPSSRLGNSIGYASPTPVANTPRAGRPSFDGKASVSGIPVPPSGLSKSTNRRPTSRLSHAPGATSSPPLSSSALPLPRSHTPTFMNVPSGPQSRSSSPLDFLDTEPPPRTGGSTAAVSTRRRLSVSTNSTGITRPRGSTTSGTAPTLKSVATGVRTGAVARPASGTATASTNGGPPVSWRPGSSTAGRSRSSSIGSR